MSARRESPESRPANRCKRCCRTLVNDHPVRSFREPKARRETAKPRYVVPEALVDGRAPHRHADERTDRENLKPKTRANGTKTQMEVARRR